MDKNLPPAQYAAAHESTPGYITIHMPGKDYLLSHKIVGQIFDCILPLLPYPPLRQSHRRAGKIAALITALFSSVCGITLFLGTITNPNINHNIAGWMLGGVLLQSAAFLFVTWKDS